MTDFYDDIVKAIPDFKSTMCTWIHRCDTWESNQGRCCRLVICFDDRLDISLVATGVRENTLGKTEGTPGQVPFIPYDLGELLIVQPPPNRRYVLVDELKNWHIAADSWAFEGVVPHEDQPAE